MSTDKDKNRERQNRFRERMRRARTVADNFEDRFDLLEAQVQMLSVALGTALRQAIENKKKAA